MYKAWLILQEQSTSIYISNVYSLLCDNLIERLWINSVSTISYPVVGASIVYIQFGVQDMRYNITIFSSVPSTRRALTIVSYILLHNFRSIIGKYTLQISYVCYHVVTISNVILLTISIDVKIAMKQIIIFSLE